jgi:hypothetical protein
MRGFYCHSVGTEIGTEVGTEVGSGLGTTTFLTRVGLSTDEGIPMRW